jgi:hypothetical protein
MDGNAIIETLLEYFGELAGDSDEERKRFNALIEEFFNISKMCAWEGEPFDRIRSLIQIAFPELNTFEADLREIVNAV